MTSPPRVSPYLLLTLANVAWSSNWIVGRAFRDELPPIALSFWRWVVAVAFLLALSWPHLRRDRQRLVAAWPWLLAYGALGTGGCGALAYVGLQYTTAINGTLLNSFVPVMIVLISWLTTGKRLRRHEAAGILISFIGVLDIVARGELQRLLGMTLNIGDLWVLASVLAWSGYTVLLVHRPQVHPLSFLAAIGFTGLLFLAPSYVWELSQGRHIVATPATIAGIVWAGIVPAVLGYILWNRGVAEVGASRAGLFVHLLPAFGIVLSTIFLDERPALFHLVGIGLILAGIWLNTRRTQ